MSVNTHGGICDMSSVCFDGRFKRNGADDWNGCMDDSIVKVCGGHDHLSQNDTCGYMTLEDVAFLKRGISIESVFMI